MTLKKKNKVILIWSKFSYNQEQIHTGKIFQMDLNY